MRTSWHGITFPITGPLWENPQVTGRFPSQKASGAELWFCVVVRLNKQVNKQSICHWFDWQRRACDTMAILQFHDRVLENTTGIDKFYRTGFCYDSAVWVLRQHPTIHKTIKSHPIFALSAVKLPDWYLQGRSAGENRQRSARLRSIYGMLRFTNLIKGLFDVFH